MTTTECAYVDPGECAMDRERSVAGISNWIPPCPVHGPHPDMALAEVWCSRCPAPAVLELTVTGSADTASAAYCLRDAAGVIRDRLYRDLRTEPTAVIYAIAETRRAELSPRRRP